MKYNGTFLILCQVFSYLYFGSDRFYCIFGLHIASSDLCTVYFISDYSVDWWALGVLMFEMLAGRSPFDVVGGAENPDQNTEDYLFQSEKKFNNMYLYLLGTNFHNRCYSIFKVLKYFSFTSFSHWLLQNPKIFENPFCFKKKILVTCIVTNFKHFIKMNLNWFNCFWHGIAS